MRNFNPFVYDQTYISDIKSTNIPSWLPEQYSQCGEDIIIVSIIRALRESSDIGFWVDGLCFEIGANHAFGGSNSYLLESKLGLRSVLVEANPALISDLEKARQKSTVIHAAICPDDRLVATLHCCAHNEISSLSGDFVSAWHDGSVGEESVVQVPACTMDRLFRENVRDGERIVLLSIDVEGLDLEICKTVDFDLWMPLFVQMEPSNHFHAGETGQMLQFMGTHGYVLIAQTDVNLVFASREVIEGLARISGNSDEYGGRSGHDLSRDQATSDPAHAPEVHGAGSSVVQEASNADVSIDSYEAARSFVNTRNLLLTTLSEWMPDSTFIKEVLDTAGPDDVLSLDVFDTALTRCFDSPVDLFAEVERRLCVRLGRAAKGFAEARVLAEQIARDEQNAVNPAREDITYEAIYGKLQGLLPRIADWERVSAIELDVEREALCAVPDVLALTRELRAAGGRYVFVSDMYLPADFLAEVLRLNGYEGFEKIYVSSELGLTKASGHVWHAVGADHALDRLLHVGDDPRSDVSMPLARGIRTFHYARARSERRTGAKLTPALIPFSINRRCVVLQSRVCPGARQEPSQGWYDMGRSWGVLVLGAFVNWLAQRVKTYGIDRLYFCARDGYLMKRAWEAAGYAESLPVEVRYIHISRAALNLPVAMVDSSPQYLSASLLSFLSSSTGRVSIRDALERVCLLDAKPLVTELKYGFGSLEKILDTAETIGKFEDILQKHSALIYARLADRYDLCIQYLRQEGLLDGSNNAIVDMGWHASMQRSLVTLLNSASDGRSSNLVGLYYGLWPAAGRNRYLAGPMESCFTSEFLVPERQNEVHQAVAYLEELHSPRHGTTTQYRVGEEGAIEAILKRNLAEEHQYDQCTQWFQQGTLDALKELFSADECTRPLCPEDLESEAAIAALGSTFLSPTAEELELLAGVGHCATFDHARHDPLLTRDAPAELGELRRALATAEWRVGQAKYWWQHADDARKAMLGELIGGEFRHFGTRVLQQFQ